MRYLATNEDQRTIAPASTTVEAAPADRARPTASVLGIAMAASGLSGFTATDFTVTVTISRDLAVGDRLVVKPGVVGDRALPLANMNAGTSGTAIKAQASPRITSVQMSNLKHSAQNTWTVPEALVGGATGNHAITISAKAGGPAAGGGLSLDSPATFAGPSRTVRYEGETALMRNLPLARDLVDTAAGHTGATAITGPPAFRAITAVTAVATGYAADADTGADNTGAQDKVDEDKNGASQNRIAVSSSVKARR